MSVVTKWTVSVEGGAVVFANSENAREITKPLGYCSASGNGDEIIITNAANTGEEIIRADYTSFISPTGASAAALRLDLNSNYLPVPTKQIVEQLETTDRAVLVRPSTLVELDLARRNITGQRSYFMSGVNNLVSTSWVDLHPASGDINWQTAATIVSISSSHAADTAAGLGCQSVEIHGLSATGVDQSEVVALSGATEADTLLTYLRVNRMHNEDVGTYGGSHQGDITARVDSGGLKTGEIMARMTGVEGAADSSVQYGLGEALGGHYSVPLGKVLYIRELQANISVTGSRNADIVLYEREGILTTSTPFVPRRAIWDESEQAGEVAHSFPSHIKIKPLTDIWFRVKGSGAVKISATLDFYLLDQNEAGA